MTKKNNAAQVAVQAKPCQKKAVTGGSLLPSEHQVMHAACLMVADSLQQAIKAATDPAEWRDEYHDAISAVEAALNIVQNLKTGVSSALENYEEAWWRATSVARLAMDAFPNDCVGRCV